ncbi:meiosis-specific with OB domain-containing protein [Ceratina calcarata]|uniref:Meiosis-specific with OB domain-containing protein n=1 Tax=Ceratina calcarata TaxID=156304 RepID=A0AAJ7IWN5_9HYME|nr:meiosis-specific with OB domain-containing protein [Ceratina calcarata]
MSAICKQSLKSLQPGMQNVFVIGIIVHNTNMRTIESTRMRFNNGDRGVWSFTLRGSDEDSINVTVWGSTAYVGNLSSTFRIGSIVELINPKVIERSPEDRNESFVPWVSSPCSLTINEGTALIQNHDAPSRADYEPLLAIPIRNLTGLRTLNSIFENLEELCDQYVDVLVIVTFISDVRNVITRDGRNARFRSFEALDDSTEKVVSLTLWENDWIERANVWEPKRTVILLVDARITYNNYRKKIGLSIVRKTFITENPNIPQTEALKNKVQCCEPDVMFGNFATPNPVSISTVMTIQQITTKLNQKPQQDERIQFAAILKAYVMDINVECLDPGMLTIRCAMCKKTVLENQDSCMNLECPAGNGARKPINVMHLNLKVNLKDDTGYLVGCRLSGEVAERVLGCTASEFQAMIIPEREVLKWQYVLERCDVRLHVLGPTSNFTNAIYNILSIQRIGEDEG